jgi:hypothetical protein
MLRRLTAFEAKVTLLGLVVALPSFADITPIPIPDLLYPLLTKRADISKKIDGDSYMGIPTSFLSFSTPMERRTVPTTWATWGQIPLVEAVPCVIPSLPFTCPPVLWSKGKSTVTITLSTPAAIFGFEAEPSNPQVETLQATFFDKKGIRLGQITLDPSGYEGANLFAASSPKFDISEVTIADLSPMTRCGKCDFAIANIRLKVVPEPSPAILLGAILFGLGLKCAEQALKPFRITRRIRRSSGRA